MTRIPESNRMSNWYIFNFFIKTSDIFYRGSPWHITIENEGKNLVENLKDNKISKNAECENNFEVKKLGTKKSVIWNHIESIRNWNQKDSDSIHIDHNHTDSNKLNRADSTNIRSIHDSANICAIENILALWVHSMVHSSPILTYRGESDSLSPLHDSSALSVTPKINYKPSNNSPNPVLKVLADPDSDPISSYYFSSELSES